MVATAGLGAVTGGVGGATVTVRQSFVPGVGMQFGLRQYVDPILTVVYPDAAARQSTVKASKPPATVISASLRVAATGRPASNQAQSAGSSHK